ncbi:MAG: hypothetical protein LBD07_05690 [Spirochaetaceae bacterium]|jgi:hypothetical protein|nr:hypothetical protein [Spirochaetaceae bacterium]
MRYILLFCCCSIFAISCKSTNKKFEGYSELYFQRADENQKVKVKILIDGEEKSIINVGELRKYKVSNGTHIVSLAGSSGWRYFPDEKKWYYNDDNLKKDEWFSNSESRVTINLDNERAIIEIILKDYHWPVAIQKDIIDLLPNMVRKLGGRQKY